MRTLFAAVTIAVATILVGCQDDDALLPSSPSRSLDTAADHDALCELAGMVFDRGKLNAVCKQLRNIDRQAGRGQTVDAAEKAVDLIEFVLDHFNGGRLNDPPGPDTTEDVLGELLARIAELGGLLPPGSDLIPPGAFTEEGAVEMCTASAGCTVTTGTEFAGTNIPAGTPLVDANTGEPVDDLIVVINRESDTLDPFTQFGFDDFPLFYNITTIPEVEIANGGLNGAQENEMLVGVCVVDPPDPLAPPPDADLRIARLFEGDEGQEVEITPLRDASFLDCTGANTNGEALTGWRGWLASVFGPASSVLDVTPLYANPGRLGGAISAFSTYGAVDVTADTETTTSLSIDDPSLFDLQMTSATATVSPPPNANDEPSVNFIVDKDTEGEQTITKFLEFPEGAEATVDILCDVSGESNGEFEPDIVIGEGAHTVEAGFPGSPGFMSSSSGQEVVTCTQTPSEGGTIRVSGFDGQRARAPLTGVNSSTLVMELGSSLNFGSNGVVACEVDIQGLIPTANPGTLVDGQGNRNFDVFFAAMTSSSLSAAEATELVAFMNAGGIVYLSGNSGNNEGPSYNPLFAELDVADQYAVDTSTAASPTSIPVPTPVTNGPFGVVGPMTHTLFRILEPSESTTVASSGEIPIVAELAVGDGYLSWQGDPLYFSIFTDSDVDNLNYFLNLFALGCSNGD